MATVTHYIYSRYDPKDREKLQAETGQTSQGESLEGDELEEDPWQTESSFSARRRIAGAPKFVPAAISYNQLNEMIGLPAQPASKSSPPPSTSNVAGWYRSLARADADASSQRRSSTAPPEPRASTPDTRKDNIGDTTARSPQERRDKNNWFISRALHSEPASKPATPPPTLADILAREPPPNSNERPFQPPVFLALGPANRGWTMLQRSGWSEGEGLGADAPRHAKSGRTSPVPTAQTVSKDRAGHVTIKQEEYETPCDYDGEISEVRKVDIVDLTLSDSDDEEGIPEVATPPPVASSSTFNFSESHSTPLLTPIATVLKSDRLGIGLKAKTVGPYKASKKRITHNQAALAAHIRANEEMRRLKAITGRGTRGFARLAKAEEEKRKQLLASLNSG